MPQLMGQGEIAAPVRGTLLPALRDRLHDDCIAVDRRKISSHGVERGGQPAGFQDIQADELLFADGIQQAEAVQGKGTDVIFPDEAPDAAADDKKALRGKPRVHDLPSFAFSCC